MWILEMEFIGIMLIMGGLKMEVCNYLAYSGWDLCMGSLVYYYEVLLDGCGLMFMGVVLLVSGMVLSYSLWYVDSYLSRFMMMMNLFVISMLLLIISPSMISMLLGWDGLGVVSFCLVSFYYGSSNSVDSSLITMLYNRFGDALILVSIGLLVVFKSFMLSFVSWTGFVVCMLILGLMTKSGQFPFSSWLPKAMAAPTPVSCLVHSSTLVTAGIYLLVRHNVNLDGYMLELMGLITMIISGIGALVESDVKKVIAYSTLSQMGLMAYMLSKGFSSYVYFHMLSHAFFKCMMFMGAGVIIHEVGSQDIRVYGGVYRIMPFSIIMIIGGLMSLMGFVFMSGYYSKDLLFELELTSLIGYLSFYGFMLGFIFTFIYSFRLLYYLVVSDLSLMGFFSVWDDIISIWMLLLYFFSIIWGGLFILMLYEYSLYDYISILVKILSFLMIILGLMFLFVNINFDFIWLKSVYLNLLMLDSLHYYLKIYLYVISGCIECMEKVYVEFYYGYGMFKLFYKSISIWVDYNFFFIIFFVFFLLLGIML